MMHQDLPIEHSKAVDPKQDETGNEGVRTRTYNSLI